MSPWETTEANTLVGVQLGVTAATIVAGLLEARVVVEHGYIAGAQGILLSENGGTHQNDLGAGNRGTHQIYLHTTESSMAPDEILNVCPEDVVRISCQNKNI